MAKKVKPPSPEAKAKEMAQMRAKAEAKELEKIRKNAFDKGRRFAARMKAREEGFAAGMRAEQKKRR